jgi:hypothetical protein
MTIQYTSGSTLELLEEIILTLEQDENKFWIALDHAHELKAEISKVLDIDSQEL